MRELVRADLEAMFEGAPVSRARVLARLAVHARYRAVLGWRVAQALFRHRWSRPLALLVSDRVLAQSGAELQPGAQIGPGCTLKHSTGLVVGTGVRAGSRLTLHQNVTLGDKVPYGGQPVLGDDVTIGAGACILGPIRVGDRVSVAAGSVVLHDVPDDVLVAGAPARIVRTRAGTDLQTAPSGAPGDTAMNGAAAKDDTSDTYQTNAHKQDRFGGII